MGLTVRAGISLVREMYNTSAVIFVASNDCSLIDCKGYSPFSHIKTVMP